MTSPVLLDAGLQLDDSRLHLRQRGSPAAAAGCRAGTAPSTPGTGTRGRRSRRRRRRGCPGEFLEETVPLGLERRHLPLAETIVAVGCVPKRADVAVVMVVVVGSGDRLRVCVSVYAFLDLLH